MFNKQKLLNILLSIFLFLFSSIYVAMAIDIDSKYNNIDSYKSYMLENDTVETGDIYNTFANFLFGIAKWIASITDFFLKYLYDNKALDNLADTLGDMSSRIYENLFGQLGALLFVISILFISFKYLLSNVRGLKDFINLFLAIGIGILWITNASTIIKGANTLSSELQGIIANSGNKITNNSGISGSSGTDLMREKAFEKMVEQPFIIINFNSLNSQGIKSISNNLSNEERINNLLSNQYNNSEKNMDDYLEENEMNGTDDLEDITKQNYYVSDESGGHKILVAIVSIFMNFLYMIPFNLISFFNFILQVQVLFFVLVFPFSIILSLLPNMSSNYIGVAKKIVGLYIVKAMLGLFVLFVDLIMSLVETIMNSAVATALTTYSVSTIIFFVALYSMYKKRTDIAKTLSKSKYTSDLSLGINGLSKVDDKINPLLNKGYENLKDMKNKFKGNNNIDNNIVQEAPSTNNYKEQEEVTRTNQELIDKKDIKQNEQLIDSYNLEKTKNSNDNNFKENQKNTISKEKDNNLLESNLNYNNSDEKQYERTSQNIKMNNDYLDSSLNENTSYDDYLNSTDYNSYKDYNNYNSENNQDYLIEKEEISNYDNPLDNIIDLFCQNYNDENSYVTYSGKNNNIQLDKPTYDNLLKRLDNNKEKLDSFIDYASESKEQGLYSNQTDIRRMENLVSYYEKNKDNINFNRNIQKDNKNVVRTPDYIKEQLNNINEYKSESSRKVTDEDMEEHRKFMEYLSEKNINNI